MQTWLAGLAITIGASGCAVMSGAVTAPDAGRHGVELRAFSAVPLDGVGAGGPNVASVAYRQIGDDTRTAFALGWLHSGKLGDATVFGRLMIDLIAREHVAGADHTRTLSPMFELGVMPFGRGACLSAAAAWDVRIDEPDQAIIGAFFGWCSLVR